MVGPPLTSTYGLRDCLPFLTWQDLECELSKQNSKIPFNSHTTQAFACLCKAPMSLRCTCIIPVNYYQKFITQLT